MVLNLLCLVLIQDIPPVRGSGPEQISLKKAVSMKEFWILFFAFSITVAGPVYLVQKYKDIAEFLHLMSDKSLSLLGSVGALLACGCKLLFGQMNDMYGFRTVYNTMIALIIIIGVLINFGIEEPIVFGLYVCMSYTTLGGHYTILAPFCRLLYGNSTGMKVWALLYNTIGIGSVIAFLVYVLQGDTANYAVAFMLLSCTAVISFVAFCFSNTRPIYDNELSTSLIEEKKIEIAR